MHRRIVVFSAAVAAAAALPGVAAASTSRHGGASSRHAAGSPPHRYYLALGDSLSQGMQPSFRGVLQDTNQGYADDLLRAERHRVHGLRLVKLGCGGETTGSMLTGRGNARNAKRFHCHRAGGSQLAAAKRFLKAHHQRGEVPLITIDIGANDVDRCSTAADLSSCVSTGISHIRRNVPKILRAIRKAAPAGTTFASMTLYDPVLAEYFSADPDAQSLAAASPLVLKQVNDRLTSADRRARFRTADVAGAFDSYDSTRTVSWEGRRIPINVARVCSWTWACQTPPTGPNIHANKDGYMVMARSFERAIGRLR